MLDPAVLVYAGYSGGSGGEEGLGIAVDGSGNAYVTGFTGSTEATFPETVGPELTHNGGFLEAFVAKISGNGAIPCPPPVTISYQGAELTAAGVVIE